MMTNPLHFRPGERRKTARIPFEPLRIRLDGSREGILVNLSEGGGLLVMSMSPPRDNNFKVTIERKDTPVVVATTSPLNFST